MPDVPLRQADMADSRTPSGDRIRSGLAALLVRSRNPEKPRPGPVVRTHPQGSRHDGQSDFDEPVRSTGRTADPFIHSPALPRRRGPQKSPVKVQISIRLDADLLEMLRASGRGWQSRLNAQLRQVLTEDCSPRDGNDPATRSGPAADDVVAAFRAVSNKPPGRP